MGSRGWPGGQSGADFLLTGGQSRLVNGQSSSSGELTPGGSRAAAEGGPDCPRRQSAAARLPPGVSSPVELKDFHGPHIWTAGRAKVRDPDLEGGPGPRRSDRRRALGRRFRWIGGPFAMPRARRPFRCTLAHARRPWISSVHHAHYARSCHAKARVPTSNARSRTSLQASGTGSRRAGIPAISGLVRHACVRRPAACATRCGRPRTQLLSRPVAMRWQVR